jgi:hypothetical protein
MIGESSRISMLRCTNAEDMVTIVFHPGLTTGVVRDTGPDFTGPARGVHGLAQRDRLPESARLTAADDLGGLRR